MASGSHPVTFHSVSGKSPVGQTIVFCGLSAVEAGSPATVATAWKIDSASAARFTVEFHRRSKEGLSKAAAMRQAALAVMKIPACRHPFYWSSFSLVGQGY